MNKAQLRGSGRAKSLGRLGLNKSCQADHVHRCQVEEDKEAQRRNEHLAIFGGGGVAVEPADLMSVSPAWLVNRP